MQKVSSYFWSLFSLQFSMLSCLSGLRNRDLFLILAGHTDKSWKHLLQIFLKAI